MEFCERIACSNCSTFVDTATVLKVDSSYFCDIICFCENRRLKKIVLCIQCKTTFAIPRSQSELKYHKSYLMCSSPCLKQFSLSFPFFCCGCGIFFTREPVFVANREYCSVQCRDEIEKICCGCGRTSTGSSLVSDSCSSMLFLEFIVNF